MNASLDAIDYTTLGWIKPELDETLRRTREEIEAFLEDPNDRSRMRFCAGYLHQVQGSLRMLELYAPAAVAEEMQHLAEAMAAGAAHHVEQACAALMRGTLQLPDYLERLQEGHRDVPVVLLPLLNDLRAARGEGELGESALFAEQSQASDSEIEHARGSVSGRNRALLDTVAAAVKEDLMHVKDALDLHLRAGEGDPARLRQQADTLGRVADTLGMLGLHTAGGMVQEQRDAITAIVHRERSGDEAALMDIAGALLHVEATMDEQVARLSAGDSVGEELLGLSESRKLAAVLAREAIANFADARQGLVAFVESSWDHSHLSDVPRLLQEVTGALRMLELEAPADYLVGIRCYVERELIDHARVPSGRQLDSLADALASVEYYLEALRDQRSNRDNILDIARQSLESLHYWPLPALTDDAMHLARSEAFDHRAPATADDAYAGRTEAAPEAADTETEPAAQSAFVQMPPVVAEEAAEAAAPVAENLQAPAPTPATGAGTQIGGFDATSDDIDDEIREVFLEEFEEEIDSLRALLPAWRQTPEDGDKLQAVRRIFHTLKGSGRLVGAKTLGEFSWKIEHMLNNVRDGHRAATPAVVELVQHVADVLPQLHVSLRDGTPLRADLDGITAVADRLANGEEALYKPAGAVSLPVEEEAVAEPVGQHAAVPETALETTQTAAHHAVPEPATAEHATEPATPEERVSAEPASAPALAEADTVTASQVDAVLLEILQAEVEGHLQTMDGWLQRAQGGQTMAEENLLRSLHTMNGAFAMADVPTITEAILPAEGYIRRLLGNRMAARADGVAALTDLAACIRQTLQGLLLPEPRVPIVGELAKRMSALRESVPDAVWPPREVSVEELEIEATLRLEAERYEAEQLQAQRDEAERLETERLEAERLEAQRLEAERAEAERLEAERLEAERLEAQRLEAERLEAERLEAQRLETERLEAERLEAERLEAERAEAERLEAERAEAERLEVERLEVERLEAERLEAERLEAERLEAERLEAERLEAEQVAAHAEQVALEAQLLELARLDAEKAASLRIEEERAEAERQLAEQRAQERIQAVRARVESNAADSGDAIRLITEELRQEAAQAELRAKEFEDFMRLEEQRLESMRSAGEREEAARRAQAQIEAGHLEAARLQREAEVASLREKEFLDFVQSEESRLAEQRALQQQAEAAAAPVEPAVSVLLARALAGAEDPEQMLDEADLDVELVDLFVEEAGDLLDHSDGLLALLREGDENPYEHIAGLQRDLHTIKGGARMAGMMAIGELGHAMESLLEALAERQVALDETSVPLLEIGYDRLHAMVTRIGERRAVALPEKLIAEFDARARGGTSLSEESLREGAEFARAQAQEADEAQAQSESADAQPAQTHPAESTLPALVGADESAEDALADETEAAVAEADAAELAAAEAAIAHAAAPAPSAIRKAPLPWQDIEYSGKLPPLSPPFDADRGLDDDSIVQAPQEQVRIRADLLDRLVNYAGEVAIYRARLEQQLGGFRSAMLEMEQTNTRLRDQLRRLDAETEAQIVARYQREQEVADATFDPLELDRFSNLQQLSRALAESAADLTSLQATLVDSTRQYETLLLQQSRVSSELQEGLMRTRMLPFDTLVPRLRRVVRLAASETGKQAALKLEGAHGELDRSVLERMTAPLEHMLRNAIAHGVEAPQERRKSGKAEEGTVRIAVRREGSEVVLEVGDDGRGLNTDAIRRRAGERGLIRDETALTDSDLHTLIFEPGFSTADEVSRLAGRGVGMDVVAGEVRQLGGSIDIATEPGRGTSFTLRLPQTLAVTQAVFVRIGESTFAVPIASVRGVGRINRDELGRADAVYNYGGEEYALHDLGLLLGQAPARAEGQLQMPLLLVRAGDLRAAVSVDEVIGSREIVVKPVGPQVASVPGIFGATIMGDGRVVVILDVAPLVRRQVSQPRTFEPVAETVQRPVPLVMVVDDSVTMRKVTGRVLERNGLEVVAAKDGVDALERLDERVPDLMLLDIEMPRMDGYELASRMRADVRLRDVPIIMITSRTGEKHRQRAFEIGVERYLGKPYQEPELMRNVFELLVETGAMQQEDRNV